VVAYKGLRALRMRATTCQVNAKRSNERTHDCGPVGDPNESPRRQKAPPMLQVAYYGTTLHRTKSAYRLERSMKLALVCGYDFWMLEGRIGILNILNILNILRHRTTKHNEVNFICAQSSSLSLFLDVILFPKGPSDRFQIRAYV